ncbi:MAG: hypothetical protein ABIS67_03815 [Candidatus Eisenbacteria bacterium]
MVSSSDPGERPSNIVPLRLVQPVRVHGERARFGTAGGPGESCETPPDERAAPDDTAAPTNDSLRPLLRYLADPREPFLVPLTVLLITHVVMWFFLPYAGEDAYITFRYARNLVLGYGLTFNPGEPVMGFTSPLWTLWNALGYALVHNPPIWSRASSVVANATTLLVVTALVRQHSRAAAWVFAALFAGWTYFPNLAASGMETGLMVALMAVSAALAARRHAAAGPTLAALALVRPEGAVAALILALSAGWRDRLVALAIAGAGYGALTAYFGSPLPQSVLAKAQLYGTPGVLAGRHWWEWAMPLSFGRWPVTSEGQFLFLMSVVAGPAAVLGAIELWKHRGSALFWLATAGLAVWAGYCISGTAYFWWYLAVPLATYFLLAALGLPRMVRGPALYIAGALFIAGTWTIVFHFYAGRAKAEHNFAEAGTLLSARSTAWQSVMLEPIGLVGYLCKLRVIDEMGLVTPAVARRRATGEPGWYTDLVRAARPDWLVVRRGVVTNTQAFAGKGQPFRSAAERDAVFSDYRLVTWVDPASPDGAVGIFERVK